MEQLSHELSPYNVRERERDAVADLTETLHDFHLESQGENNTERGRGEDLESNQSLNSTSKECESTTTEGYEANLEQKSIAKKTESLPSPQAAVNPHNKISAWDSGIVTNPNFKDCNIENFNITITSGKESIVPSKKESVNAAAPLHKNKKIEECKQKLKETLKRKFKDLRTGNDKMPLDEIYTEVCIIEGGNCEVNTEHEVIKEESAIKQNQEKSIHCNHLFNPPPGQDRHIRTVITRGVAGIGKTVCANKFILDWAEERENTNLDFVFPLPFRDLKLVGDKPISLVGLINKLFPETKDTEIFKDTGILNNDQYKMLFILDGLDESLLSLDFKECEIVTDVTQPTETAVLITNIIRGRLLPSAFIWIISRPDASSKIPSEHIDLRVEVRGFNNTQKDEYFRSIISRRKVADKVISHVKSCQSLYIMCHIPFFCWKMASLLKTKPATPGGTDMPATLTPMYIHFLTECVDSMSKKLRDEANPDSVRKDLIYLGKLAFEELAKGKFIFNESSLIQNGIKVTGPNLFSGLYTQIFSEDLILCQENTFCFVHRSVQEFFAALYVYLKFNNDNVIVLNKNPFSRSLSRDSSELTLYKAAVKKALQCERGHFDIFLRFLLGLSLESNQTLLKHLLIHNRTNQNTRAEIIKYIKKKIQAGPPPDRCDNLHLCLNELNDDSEMIQRQARAARGATRARAAFRKRTFIRMFLLCCMTQIP